MSPSTAASSTGSTDKTLRIWDLKTGKEEFKLDKHESYVNSVVFSPTGKKAISAAGYYLYDKNGQIVYKNNVPVYVDCTVRLWDVDYGNEVPRSTRAIPPSWARRWSRPTASTPCPAGPTSPFASGTW